MVELDHSFSTGKPAGYNLDAILDLDRIIPCVEGGKVIERESPDLVLFGQQTSDGGWVLVPSWSAGRTSMASWLAANAASSEPRTCFAPTWCGRCDCWGCHRSAS